IKIDLPERACRVLRLIESMDADVANNLRIETAVIDVDIPQIVDNASCSKSNEAIGNMLTTYFTEAKSVSKARMLNAILPGAGYYYVGQKKSAVTSFIINALFIAAAYQLFDRGYIPAAIIVTSLEMGWYFGGINGAGIEANQYNETIYSRVGRETLANERLFPILMIQKGF
ncbi:MAG TPA: tetratricopeptide repeat protein, partial [Parachlamydiaceae bacterium]|nr:tetratricopeptide repeat protein [Parachlamydiaceae bacterium]